MTDITTYLDVDCLLVTRHALERYVHRRAGRNTDWVFVDRKLRELLRQAEGKGSPIILTGPSPVRRYVAGGFAFIVSADHTTLITVYPWKPATKPSHGGSRRARQGRRPRFDDVAVDEYDDMEDVA